MEPRFATPREAKEFLIGWIDAEARRRGEPLMELERKILYASPKGWTLPDMDEVQDAFNRYHDPSEYEEKIRKLIRSIRIGARAAQSDEWQAWQQAVQALGSEKNYLGDLIASSEGTVRERSFPLKFWLVAVAVCVALALLALWMNARSSQPAM